MDEFDTILNQNNTAAPKDEFDAILGGTNQQPIGTPKNPYEGTAIPGFRKTFGLDTLKEAQDKLTGAKETALKEQTRKVLGLKEGQEPELGMRQGTYVPGAPLEPGDPMSITMGQDNTPIGNIDKGVGLREKLSFARSPNEFESIFRSQYPEGVIFKTDTGGLETPDGNIYYKETPDGEWQRYTAKWNLEELPFKLAQNTREIVSGTLATAAAVITRRPIVGPMGVSLGENAAIEAAMKTAGIDDASFWREATVQMGADLLGGLLFDKLLLPGANVAAGKGTAMFGEAADAAGTNALALKYEIPALLLSQRTDNMAAKRYMNFLQGVSSRVDEYITHQRGALATAYLDNVLNFDPPTELRNELIAKIMEKGESREAAQMAVDAGFQKLKERAVASKFTAKDYDRLIGEYTDKLTGVFTTNYTTASAEAARGAENIIRSYSTLSKLKENELYANSKAFIKKSTDIRNPNREVENIAFDVSEAKKAATELYNGLEIEMDAKHVGYLFKQGLSKEEGTGYPLVERWYYEYKRSSGKAPTDEMIKDKFIEAGYDISFKAKADNPNLLANADPLHQVVQALFKGNEQLSLEEVQRLRHALIETTMSRSLQGQPYNDWYSSSAKKLVSMLTDSISSDSKVVPNQFAKDAASEGQLRGFIENSKKARTYSKARYDLLDTQFNSRILTAEFETMTGALLDNKGRDEAIVNLATMVGRINTLKKQYKGTEVGAEIDKSWANIQESFKTSLMFDSKNGLRTIAETIEHYERNPNTRTIINTLMPDKKEREKLKEVGRKYATWEKSHMARLEGADATGYAKVASFVNHAMGSDIATAQELSFMMREAIKNQDTAVGTGAKPVSDTVYAKKIQDTLTAQHFENLFTTSATKFKNVMDAEKENIKVGGVTVLKDKQYKAALKDSSAQIIQDETARFVTKLEQTGFIQFFDKEKIEHIQNISKIATKVLQAGDAGQNLQSAELLARLSKLPPDTDAWLKFLTMTKVAGPIVMDPKFAKILVRESGQKPLDLRTSIATYMLLWQPQKQSMVSSDMGDNNVDEVNALIQSFGTK